MSWLIVARSSAAALRSPLQAIGRRQERRSVDFATL
jgi:hypothetical protein